MRNKRVKILAIAALLSVAAAGIGTASAYFTSYVEAKGQKVIHLGDTTTVTEKVTGKEKTITISNDAKSPRAVWVRAKAYTAEAYMEGLVYTPGAGWTDTNPAGQKDGYYYYLPADEDKMIVPLEPGGTTTELKVGIEKWPEAKIDRDFNVVVIYETTPAVENGVKTDESGTETIQYVPPTMQDDWSRTVTVK